VARFDAVAGELDVDFVIHGDYGPASSWASRAQVGDAIGLAGPGGPSLVKRDADAYLLSGDPSAFAAIRAALASLPVDAQGLCLLEVASEDEILPMQHPQGIHLQYLIRGADASAARSNLMLDAAMAWTWPQGDVSVTLAGESSQLVRLRKFVVRERGVAKDALYAVPYWKEDLSEEAYHAERHRIMDEVAI
jgi:NADPH-dependent ferric siderophore reductase